MFRGTLSLDGREFDAVRDAMELPQPRVALGLALRGLASSAIDVSDGMLGDLAHILERSGVDAVVDVDVPRSVVLRAQPMAVQRLCTLSGGDDYELLFTAAADRASQVAAAAASAGVAVSRIGRIVPRTNAGPPAPVLNSSMLRGQSVVHRHASFDHFRT